MRSRLLLVATGIVAGVVFTLGGVWANGLRAHVETDGYTIAGSAADIAGGAAYTLQVARLCLDGADHARVAAVRPVGAHGNVEVTDFSLTSVQELGHSRPGTLDDYLDSDQSVSTGPATRALSTRCSDANDFKGLAVEFKAPAPADLPVALSSFMIDYEVRGISKSVEATTGMTFCAGDGRDEALIDLQDDDGASLNVQDCQPDDS